MDRPHQKADRSREAASRPLPRCPAAPRRIAGPVQRGAPCMETAPIDPAVRIGHIHLKVADIDRALAFYCGVLGFEVTQWYGKEAVFLSAGGYHHHVGL